MSISALDVINILGMISAVGLATLLLTRELMSASNHKYPMLLRAIDIAIVPLGAIFFGDVLLLLMTPN
jgi:hypothetical protein